MKLSAVVVALLLPSMAAAQEYKDCSITSTGLVLADYQRSSDQFYRMLAAAEGITPRLANGTRVGWGQGGKIVILTIGMSNAVQSFAFIPSVMKKLISTPEDGTLKAPPEIVVIRGSIGGYATREWADPNSFAWTIPERFLARAGVTSRQVEVLLSMHAVLYPKTRGTMRKEDVAKVLANAQAKYPYIRIHQVYDLNYTGYLVNANAHPDFAEVVANGYVLANMARTQYGAPRGTALEYVQVAADGLHHNPRTASRSYPAGLAYPCDWIADDGVHLARLGQAHVGTNLTERIVDDPVFAFLKRKH